jgi:dTDP-4-dehydrorhamnose reductase
MCAMARVDAPYLVVGAHGMLGKAWCALFEGSGIDFESAASGEIDIADQKSVDRAISPRYRAIVNCAAYTDVDGAESNIERAMAVNGDGAGHLADACQRAGVPLIHFSSDYVFDGKATRPYAVEAELNPVNAYGRSKARGEELIRQSGCEHLIVRTSWLYGPWGRNFVATIARLVHEREKIRVVNDQRGRPTSVESLAAISHKAFESGARGTVHICDDGTATWFDLAREVGSILGAPCRIEPCTSAEYPTPAHRPKYSVLDVSVTRDLFADLADWRTQVAMTLCATAQPQSGSLQ